MPGHARTPGRHRRLGGPLPRQQANTTTARPTTPELWSPGDAAPPTSLGITRSFPRLYPTMGLVTVALLTLAPLALRPVRLACLIHAANVHSEPGSNPSRLGTRPKGPSQSSSLRILAKLTGRRESVIGEEINPPPHVPRQHEPSDSTASPLRDPRREQIGPHPRRLPSKVRSNSLACTQTIDRIVKEERRGINSTLDATGRSDSP